MAGVPFASEGKNEPKKVQKVPGCPNYRVWRNVRHARINSMILCYKYYSCTVPRPSESLDKNAVVLFGRSTWVTAAVLWFILIVNIPSNTQYEI